MPRVTVHESSDGKLHRTYEEYVAHEEALNFSQKWDEAFGLDEKTIFESSEQADATKAFVERYKEQITAVITASKVKRKSPKK